MKLLVIADDFISANDTRVQFNKSGFTVDVLLNSVQPYQGSADVVIVNTNSRAMMIENAHEQIKYFWNPYPEVLPVITKADVFGSLGVLQNMIDFINNINEGVCK